jgi:hypothetical protein
MTVETGKNLNISRGIDPLTPIDLVGGGWHEEKTLDILAFLALRQLPALAGGLPERLFWFFLRIRRFFVRFRPDWRWLFLEREKRRGNAHALLDIARKRTRNSHFQAIQETKIPIDYGIKRESPARPASLHLVSPGVGLRLGANCVWRRGVGRPVS